MPLFRSLFRKRTSRSGDTIEYLAGSGNKVILEISIAVGNLVIEEY